MGRNPFSPRYAIPKGDEAPATPAKIRRAAPRDLAELDSEDSAESGNKPR